MNGLITKALGVAVLFSLASVEARAAVSVLVSQGVPAGLAGYTTFDLTAVTDAGVIMAMDFSNAGGRGFSGPLHQIGLPDFATIFGNDMGELLALAQSDPSYGELLGLSELESVNPSQDSHFTVNTSKVLFVAAAESEESLYAAFALANPAHLSASASWTFAHLVVPNGSSVSYAGQLVIYDTPTAGGGTIVNVGGTLTAPTSTPIPEPHSMLLLVTGIGLVVSGRRTSMWRLRCEK